MIAMSESQLLATYYLELDRQNLAWKKRKNISRNLVSRRATNHELMIASWIDIQDKKKQQDAPDQKREVWRGSRNNVSAEWVRMDFLTRFGI
jgi:hypothetical protein